MAGEELWLRLGRYQRMEMLPRWKQPGNRRQDKLEAVAHRRKVWELQHAAFIDPFAAIGYLGRWLHSAASTRMDELLEALRESERERTKARLQRRAVGRRDPPTFDAFSPFLPPSLFTRRFHLEWRGLEAAALGARAPDRATTLDPRRYRPRRLEELIEKFGEYLLKSPLRHLYDDFGHLGLEDVEEGVA